MNLNEDQKDACLRAAEYISERGHFKGAYFGGSSLGMTFEEVVASDNLNPPACALGAIAKVTRCHVEDVRKEYSVLLATRLGYTLPIQDWNDKPETSAEDVVVALKRLGVEG